MFANNLGLSVHKTPESDHNQSKHDIQVLLPKHVFLKRDILDIVMLNNKIDRNG